jgi:hypothetical protein
MAITYHAGRRIQGLSSDTKPTNVQSGSRFEETDTRKIYNYLENLLIFEDDYTTNSGWTQTGTKVTVDSGTPDKVKGTGNSGIGTQESVTKSLGVTLSNTTWSAEFELKMISASDWYSIPFGLSAGTSNIETATQDSVGITFNGNGGLQPKVYGFYKDGSGSWTQVIPTSILYLTAGTLYYLRVERTSSTNIKISVFTDSGRTTHITNSPYNFTIPSTIGGLTTIQHSHRADSFANNSTWEIDNVKIYDAFSSTGFRWAEEV